MSTPTTSSEPFDPSSRRLCPDGACVGLLDADNRCRECGAVDANAGPWVPGTFVPVPPTEVDDDEVSDDLVRAAGDFDPRRQLCPDGACVGVIGDDARCRVCGRAQET